MVRLIISLAAIVCLFSVPFAKGDMTLTLDDGKQAILHEDNTWGYSEFHLSDGTEEDIYITVGDGRTILLRTDGTWTFTKETGPKKKSVKELPSVQSSGTATKGTLDIAVKAATDQAIQKAAVRFLPYVTKSKMTQKYIEACIKNEIGESGAEVSYQPKWTAVAKLNLDVRQVKSIVECVETQIALQPQDTTKAVKTKAAAK
jgi:hypothetical protein